MHFLAGTMEEPEVISWWHLIMIIPIIAASILVTYFLRNTSEKVYKRVLLISWIILLVLEFFKELIKAFHYGNPSYWQYSLRDFPFSICSMVYYFIPIILFVDKKKHPSIVDAANGYMCFILLTAGAVVCTYPKMATDNFIYINIQTFIHHGSQVVLGLLIFIWNRKNITIKTFYRSMIAFGITVVIAISINLIFYGLFPGRFVNMFFINPTIITNLPIGNIVQEKAGYPVYLIGFVSVIALVAFLAYFVETSIYKLVLKKSKA